MKNPGKTNKQKKKIKIISIHSRPLGDTLLSSNAYLGLDGIVKETANTLKSIQSDVDGEQTFFVFKN